MSLAGKLAFQVDRGAQFRGSELFQNGAVQVTAVEPDHIHATVAGGADYEVCIQFFNQELLVSCECPYFRDRGACKHIWAVILESDRRGALPAALAQRRLGLLETASESNGEHPGLVQTRRTARPKIFVPPPAPPPPPPPWQTELTAIQSELAPASSRPANWPPQFELIYVVETSASRASGGIVLEVKMRTRKKTGEWSVPREFKLSAGQIELVPDPEDRHLLTMLVGGVETYSYSYASTMTFSLRKALPAPLALELLPRMAAAGRLFTVEYSGVSSDLHPLGWDDGEPWRLWLEVRQDDRDQWKITGSLRRGEERMALTGPDLLLSSGLLVADGKVARFEHAGGFGWVSQLRRLKAIAFADRERDAALAKLLDSPVLPPMEIDEPLRFSERRVTPRLGLRITERRDWNGTHFEAVLLFDYGRGYVEEEAASRGLWSAEERVYTVRDAEAEDQARNTLLASGLRPEGFAQSWRFVPRLLPRVVRELVQAGWHVEADGKAFRQPGKSRVEVSSGIDWFDLYAEVDYGGVSASLPQLLAALRRGETMVRAGRWFLRPAARRVAGALRPAGRAGNRRAWQGQSALPHQPGRIAGCAAGGAAGSPGGRSLRTRARAPAQFRRHPRRRPARGFRGRAARLPARGPGLDGVPARIRVRRLPGRRYGRGQDGAGAGAAGGRVAPRATGRRWWWCRNR